MILKTVNVLSFSKGLTGIQHERSILCIDSFLEPREVKTVLLPTFLKILSSSFPILDFFFPIYIVLTVFSGIPSLSPFVFLVRLLFFLLFLLSVFLFLPRETVLYSSILILHKNAAYKGPNKNMSTTM
jgi:hypothetical protein